MVKNLFFICILLLAPLSIYSRQLKVYGTVKNDDGKPVEFCLVKIISSNHSTYSNPNGEFVLECDAYSSDSLIFYCLGYETKEVKIGYDTLRVILKRKLNELKDVVVAAASDEREKKHGIMGKRNLKPFGICTGDIGSEDAIFLGADAKRHGQLENIYFYITKEGIPNSRFRVHVYDIDSNSLPGEDMLDSIVILHATEGDEWVSVDVSSRHIHIGRGVFISMEWIRGYGNRLIKVTSKKFPGAAPFNGQVLAFTEGYYKQSSLLYMRTNINTNWNYWYAGGNAKGNILNPMIYATYTYYK